MARQDAVGFFWDDTPPPKAPKAEKQKRQPPEATWLRPDYLPGLEEARRFPVHLMTEQELMNALLNKEELIVDVEVAPNYFLVCFTSLKTGWVTYEELHAGQKLDVGRLTWLLTMFTTIGFNSLSYDLIILYAAIAGCTNEELYWLSKQIIEYGQRGTDVLREMKVRVGIKVDHIDLIEVAPLRASLKTYAGRLHCPKMQDLPFSPHAHLTPDQITITRWYCVNDITNTAYLRECLREHIELRYKLSNEYKVDLRSKSDAQIAEAVIAAELTKLNGKRPTKPVIDVGTMYRYNIPDFIQYKTPLMNWALDIIRDAKFVVADHGSIEMPEEIKALKLRIADGVYRMGIGGLHSSESTVAYHSDNEYILIDKDVTSYYPYIILNQGLYPKHLGSAFLTVYRTIVERRVLAKQMAKIAKDAGKHDEERIFTTMADSLKIVVNGSFGKLGSKWSILYAPDLLIQTTITGQLSLLMLIEMMELSGIAVVSANTDGIVMRVPRARREDFDVIIAEWERRTNFKTEETIYKSLYSRDVNNYIAVKEDNSTKNKGAFANPWASKKNLADRLHKNPTTTICVEAVEKYLTEGVPVDHTIRSNRDIRKFVAVRSVKGGAVKVWDRVVPPHSTKEELIQAMGWIRFAEGSWGPDEDFKTILSTEKAYLLAQDILSTPGQTDYIGKSVRWYYGKDVKGELVYASNGNKVPKSEGAVPLMVFPDQFPNDIDYDWYIEECRKILVSIGAAQEPLAA